MALPRSRYPHDELGFELWNSWQLLRGTGFELTVVDTPDPADRLRLVEGIRAVGNTHVSLDLTDEQAAALGLPAFTSRRYHVHGQLFDEAGHVVMLPNVATLRVPARWLHPAGHTDPQRPRPWGEWR